ncbi:family 31 glycoside hydrolase [Zopfochytrium polystomum]|nr:family 31 glycoside hydrolase [Zopfochytrium polystomum]
MSGAAIAVAADVSVRTRHLGLFAIRLHAAAGGEDRPGLSVIYKAGDDPSSHVAVLDSVKGVPFLRTALGEDDFGKGYGTFQIVDHDFYLSTRQTIDSFTASSAQPTLDPTVTIAGVIPSEQSPAPIPYSITFTSPSPHQLRFVVNLNDPEKRFTKVFLTFSSSLDERIFGLGEQFTHFDLKGKKVPIMSREDGVGRGKQPTTFFANTVFGKDAGGDDVSAYKPVPHITTNRLRSVFLENSDYSLFDLTARDRITIKVASPRVVVNVLKGKSPLHLIEQYTEFSGRMKGLPSWVVEGVILGIQGGESKVAGVVERALAAGVPLTGVWLQDWCGKREQQILGRILKRLWWNWENDDVLYPNWPEFVGGLFRKHKVRTLSYVNTFVADVSTGKPTYRRNLYKEALDQNFLVRDATGQNPLRINSGPNFQAGLVDLFNPAAQDWLKKALVDIFSVEGVSGYMADFGEFLPPGAVLTSGKVATTADHNLYTEVWTKLQEDVLKTVKSPDDKLIFHRSGFTKSPGLASAFWTGDQLVDWDEYDGIKAGLLGVLSSGLSGFSLNHTDVGGYSGLALEYFGRKFGNFRTKELLLRWMELNAFGVVFRSHEGSAPDNNAQPYDDEESLKHLAFCGKIFQSLADYKTGLISEAVRLGYPVVRHLYLHFHHDPEAAKLNRQFLLGPHLLVAPVLDPSTDKVRVYLPALPEGRRWLSVYDLKPADVPSYPSRVTSAAPLGRPVVFVDEAARDLESLKKFFSVIQSHK